MNTVQTRFVDNSAIRWVLFARALLGTVFILGGLLMEWSGVFGLLLFEPEPVYGYVGLIYVSSLLFAYIAVFKERWGPLAFRFILPGLDLTLVTALALFTGGSNSPFLFLYLLVIIGTAILNQRRAAIITTALSMTLFGLLLLAEYNYGLPTTFLNEQRRVSSTGLLTIAFYNIAAFYVVGILSSYLAERARLADAEVDRRELDISILRGLQDRIIDNVASGLLTLDEDGRILLVNRQAERILGLAGSRLWGSHIHHVLSTIQLDIGDMDTRQEIAYEHPDGKQRSLGYSVSRIRIDVRRVGYIVIFQDLTQVKELEAVVMRQAKLAAVGTMAAGLAHELRNPLGSISGCLQLLQQQSEMGDEERELFEIALREIGRLDGLVHDFLLYARPFRNEPRRVFPAGLFDDVTGSLKLAPTTPERTVFVNEVAPDLWVLADPHALRQVFFNLLRNAIQAGADRLILQAFTDRGGVTIQLVDNGKGFSSEALSRLFEPFFTTRPDGVGLGLAMVYRVMEEYHGSVNVDSRPGRTVMRLYFPLEQSV